jgi:hypothetical protein
VVACSVISVNHTASGTGAVKLRPTRSSWTGGPALRLTPQLLGEDAQDPLRRTQPVDPVLARTDTPGGQLVGDEPVAESRVVGVDVESGVDQMRVVPSTLRDRALFPFVERLGGEAEYPLCHRDRDTVSGQVEDQRVAHFGLTSREK